MIAVGLFLLLFFLRSASTFLNKRFQLGFKMDFPHFVYYNLLNSIAATIFYLFSVNFKLELDLTTAIISVFYATICFIGLIIGITSLKHITLPLNSVMSISGGLIGSNCFGYFILKENISMVRIIALVIVIISVSGIDLHSSSIPADDGVNKTCGPVSIVGIRIDIGIIGGQSNVANLEIVFLLLYPSKVIIVIFFQPVTIEGG